MLLRQPLIARVAKGGPLGGGGGAGAKSACGMSLTAAAALHGKDNYVVELPAIGPLDTPPQAMNL